MIKKEKNAGSIVFVFLILLFIYVPIISLVIFSFNSSKSLTSFSGFSFVWYQKLFTDKEILEAVRTTLIVAAISTVVSTVIGTLAAISIGKMNKKNRDLSLYVNNIPVVSPEIITAISLFVLFGAFGLESGYLKLLLAHIAFCTPYVVIAVYPKVKNLDQNLVDAAYDLGASPILTLIKVILPQLKTGIIAGAAIAFTMSFDDFVISLFAAGNSGVKNISIYLYSAMQRKDPVFNALSTIIILLIGVKIAYDYFKKDKKVGIVE